MISIPHKVINYITHRLLQIIILSVICLQNNSCATQEKEYRANIYDNSNWSMFEDCGYEGCYPKVDFIKQNGLIIRIELDKINLSQYIARIMFVTNNYLLEINPSNISIETDSLLTNSIKLLGSNKNRKPDYLLNEQSLSGTYKTNDIQNILVVFNYSSAKDGMFKLKFNDALMLNGKVIMVPTVYFKKTR
jgi:hypothetical protein